MSERDPAVEEETHCRLSSFDFDERRKEAAKKKEEEKKQLWLMRAPTYTQTPEKLDTSKRKKKKLEKRKNSVHTASSPHKYN